MERERPRAERRPVFRATTRSFSQWRHTERHHGAHQARPTSMMAVPLLDEGETDDGAAKVPAWFANAVHAGPLGPHAARTTDSPRVADPLAGDEGPPHGSTRGGRYESDSSVGSPALEGGGGAGAATAGDGGDGEAKRDGAAAGDAAAAGGGKGPGGAGGGGGGSAAVAVPGAAPPAPLRVPPLIVPRSRCEHVKETAAKLTSYSTGKVAAFAWAAVFPTIVGDNTPSVTEGLGLLGATFLFTAVLCCVLLALLYVARTVAAYESLREEVLSLVRDSSERARRGKSTAPHAAVLKLKKTMGALSGIVGGQSTFRVRVVELTVLRFGEAAGFSIAVVWYATTATLLPVPESEDLPVILPFLWLLVYGVTLSALLVMLDHIAACTFRSGVTTRSWGFGDVAGLSRAFRHDVVQQDAKAADLASMKARVSSYDYVLTEIEKSVAWLMGFHSYTAAVAAMLGVMASGESSIVVSWATAAVVVGFVTLLFAAMRCYRSRSSSGGLHSLHLPGWLTQRRSVARAATTGVGLDGASCATKAAQIVHSGGTKAKNLAGAAAIWLSILAFHGALRTSINPDLKPTGTPTTGTDHVLDDFELALVVSVGVLAFLVIFERVSVSVVGDDSRDQMKKLQASAAKSGKGLSNSAQRRFQELRLSYDVRAAYVATMHRVASEGASLLMALTVNQVVLDLVATRDSTAGSAFAYALVVTVVAVFVESALARRRVANEMRTEHIAAQKAAAAISPRASAAASASGGAESDVSSAPSTSTEPVQAGWMRYMDSPLEDVPDLATAASLIEATRARTIAADAEVAKLRRRLVSIASTA